MKTIRIIKDEIEKLRESLKESPSNKKVAIETKIRERTLLCYYLEFEPSPATINSQIKELSRSINILNERFSEWWKDQPARISKTEATRKYRSLAGLPKKEKQLKALRYLLGK